MNLEIILRLIGRNIARIRTEKQISQQDLAARCNFEKSNMSRIERGGSNLTISTLNIISGALEVKISELVDIETAKHDQTQSTSV